MTHCAKMLAQSLLKNNSTQWIWVCSSSSSRTMEVNSKTEVRKAQLCTLSLSKLFGGLSSICESNEAGVTRGGSATGDGASAIKVQFRTLSNWVLNWTEPKVLVLVCPKQVKTELNWTLVALDDARTWAGGWIFRLLSFMRIVFGVAVIVLFSFFKLHASCSSTVRQSSSMASGVWARDSWEDEIDDEEGVEAVEQW